LVSVARQNGKTVALKAMIMWALIEEPKRRGEPVLVISTAHQLHLATEIFEHLAPILQKDYGAKVKWSYGRNEAALPDGTRWIVQAATPKAFHGFSPHYVIADEVWNISSDVLMNGAMPSQRAMKSPLLSCWSTAGTEDSRAMLQMREEGLRAIDEGRVTKLYFAEWSVPPGVDPMSAPEVWKMANPALGYTLEPEVLADESEQVDKAAFLRASLNVWISSERSWLPPGLFDSLKVDEIPAGGVLAVDSSIDESLYCGVRAQRMPDDLIGVTVEFLADSLAGCWRAIDAAAGDCERIALTPSLFDIAPAALDRKKGSSGLCGAGNPHGHDPQPDNRRARCPHRGADACGACRPGRGRKDTTRLRPELTEILGAYNFGALPCVRGVTTCTAGVQGETCHRIRQVT
jgi:hypothetical protein